MTSRSDAHAHELDALLLLGIRKHVFPGAACAVGVLAPETDLETDLERWGTAGSLAPGENAVAIDTPYDLASLTKPFVAMTALRLMQQGALDMHQPVSQWLPELAGTHGGDRTLEELLSHRAGLSAWGSMYRELDAPPGSPEMKRFMLREAATRVAVDASPTKSLYSDLGYLIAGEAIARAGGAGLEVLVRREVTAPLGLDQRVYYAAALDAAGRDSLRARAAPTEHCDLRGGLVRGEVHDENCYAFGGIAGHAGMFGDARAVLAFGRAMLRAHEGRSRWLDQSLVGWALRARGEGHVIGWDTKSAEGSSAGDVFSQQSFGHLGFTGTSIWCDPTRRLSAVLLSNRVYPTRANIAIRAYRPRFHDAVAEYAQGLDVAANERTRQS